MTERDSLIARHLHLVPLTVARVVPCVPLKIDVGDLESAGYLGLIAAADRFDPGRGTAFRSLAISWIRGKVLEHLRWEDWVPRSVRQQERRGEPVVVLEQVSLETCGSADQGLLDELADPAPGPEERVLASDLVTEVWERLGVLSLARRQILSLYYEQGLTFRAIALRMGRSEGVVQWMHQQSLRQLKENWGDRGL